jgi:hypothetical protein
MRRGTWITVLALVALLPVADTILWDVAVGRLQTGFDAWAATSAASHIRVTRGKIIPGGWPFAATLRIENVNLLVTDPLTPDGVTWSAPEVVLRLSPLRPRSMDVVFQGEQHLHVGAMPDIVVAGARLFAVVSVADGDHTGVLDLLADQATMTSEVTGAAMADHLRVHVEIPTFNAASDAGRAFAFSAEGITLPDHTAWPLGRTIARLDCDGTVEGRILPAPTMAAGVSAWRDGGGSVQLQNVVLNWGPLSLTASATLALDDQLQPMGAGTSHVTGYAVTLDALAKSGVLTRSAATAAKALLALLAGTPGDGGPDDVDVPLTLQYRTLSMRQVPLVRFPEVDWPGL